MCWRQTVNDELYVGREVWFKVVYCEDTRRGGAYERWRQCYVTHVNTEGTIVNVRFYETTYTEVRKALRREDVKLTCPGDPLFSC